MPAPNVWTALWIGWLVYFAVVEALGYWKAGVRGTFSYHVWGWFSVTEKRPYWRLRRTTLALMLILLAFHFMNGGGWFIL